MPTDYENFSGYILAGGKSTRMGRDKAFLEVNGKTFLQNAVDILTPICEDRIKVVLNSAQTRFAAKLPNGTGHIFDTFEDRGPVGGIHEALWDCSTKFAFVIAVDMPFLSDKLLKKLAKSALLTDSDVVLPRNSDGKTQQLCTVYNAERSLPVVRKMLLTPGKSVSVLNFIERLGKIQYLTLENEDKTFFNINNVRDFDRI